MTTFTDFLLTSESSSNYVCSCCYTRWHYHTWHRCASSCRPDVLEVCRCNWSLLHWDCSSSVTHSELLSFRSRLKTWLFELTLAWHWLHSPAALHFVCVFSNSVKCPCNVTHDSVTLIFTFLMIIIIILFSRSYVWAASAAVMTLLLGRVDTNWYCNWLKLRSQLFQVSLVLFVVYSLYNLSVLIKYLWSKTFKLGIVSVWVLSYYWVVKSMLFMHIVSVKYCGMEVTEWKSEMRRCTNIWYISLQVQYAEVAILLCELGWCDQCQLLYHKWCCVWSSWWNTESYAACCLQDTQLDSVNIWIFLCWSTVWRLQWFHTTLSLSACDFFMQWWKKY